MAITTFTIANDNQSQLSSSHADYSTVHNAEVGTVAKQTFSSIGQYLSAGIYKIYRCAFGFDTSALADDALIKSAYIRGYSTSGGTRANTVILKSGIPTYPTIPTPVAADYKFANYSGNGGTGIVPLASFTQFIINLNYTGLSWISKTGYSKFLLVSEDDNISTEPVDTEFSDFYTYFAATPTFHLRLIIEHFSPTGIPVVGDPTYSGTKATYTKATANVSDVGGGYEERGFEYGISETPTWAVRETGVWGATGNYSLILPDLLPETTYYGRAYATNDYGTGYSGWTSFTTIDIPSYGLYEEDNVATICFYISEDDGMTWGQKHGPYTTDQADIEITKLLVRSSGKKKIKFESDVLTGISASVMVKLDCKAR